MLWYKAWLETRVRFLICLVVISGFCAFAVHHDLGQARGAMPAFYYGLVHTGHGVLAGLWLGAINFLMMGGLLREKSTGASPFTLVLPFSRVRLVGVRAAVGLIQATALIVIPSAAMWLQDAAAGKPWPIFQIWFHFVLMLTGGMVFLAIAFLVASVVDGEYSAPLVSVCLVIGIAFAMRDPPADKFSPFHFMVASDYFERSTGLVLGPIPWLQVGAYLLVAAVLLVASVRAIEVREF